MPHLYLEAKYSTCKQRSLPRRTYLSTWLTSALRGAPLQIRGTLPNFLEVEVTALLLLLMHPLQQDVVLRRTCCGC